MKKIALASLALMMAATTLKDKYGLPIGYIEPQGDKTFVLDYCRIRKGYVTNKGTFTMTGVPLAQSPLPFMLLETQGSCKPPTYYGP